MTAQQEQERPSKRRSLWKIAKVVCLLACIGYLCHQSMDLLWQYVAKDTQISPNYSHQDDVIPGITICYPRALSMLSILQNINNDTDLFELQSTLGNEQGFFATLKQDDYEKLNDYFIEQMRQGNNSTVDYIGPMHELLASTINYVSKVFGEPVNLTLADSLYWAILSRLSRRESVPKHPAQLFGWSIPFKKISYNDLRTVNMLIKKPVMIGPTPKEEGFPLDVSVYGVNQKDGNQDGEMIKYKDSEPIETLIFNDDADWKKCFTFFSHLKPKWRQLSMVVRRINVDVFHQMLWFPEMFFDYEGFTLSMHNPAEMASKFLGIPANKDIRIDYQVMATNQSNVKQTVDCLDYDLTSEQWWRRTRYDCIKKCLQESQEKCTNCSDQAPEECFFEGNTLWTRDQMPDYPISIMSLATKSDYVQQFISGCKSSRFHFETQCRKSCRPKCVDRHYHYQVKNSAAAFASRLEITHRLPDQLSTVLYKMSWVDFVSQVGGLFGLWLGLSFYAISEYLITLFKYLYKKLSCSNRQDKKQDNEMSARNT